MRWSIVNLFAMCFYDTKAIWAFPYISYTKIIINDLSDQLQELADMYKVKVTVQRPVYGTDHFSTLVVHPKGHKAQEEFTITLFTKKHLESVGFDFGLFLKYMNNFL